MCDIQQVKQMLTFGLKKEAMEMETVAMETVAMETVLTETESK